MAAVQRCPLPAGALLQEYARGGGYTDCFATDLPRPVTYAEYVVAFYSTWLFRLERGILRLALSRPSTDEDVRQLAAGTLERFAAWDVEQRAQDQLLLCDMFGSTRSWLMVEPIAQGTRLYFGSAVVRKAMERKSFSALLWFHVLYSRALLASARIRLESARHDPA